MRTPRSTRIKTVFFTGATGDLGFACVQALSESGRWTAFAAGTNEEKLKSLGMLPRVIPVRCDVTDQESVESARAFVLGKTSEKIDAVANFAGLTSFLSAVEGDIVGETEKLLAVNVVGMTRVNKAFFGCLKRPGGRILNCSSEAGWMTAQPFAAPYFLSKRAVEAYSDSLRRELMFLGIDVVKIQPGSFRTRITRDVCRGYDDALAQTVCYSDLLIGMKPLMDQELSQKNDPARLARIVLKALEAKRPRLRYRVGTGKLLALLEILPERGVDIAYKLFLRRQSAVAARKARSR